MRKQGTRDRAKRTGPEKRDLGDLEGFRELGNFINIRHYTGVVDWDVFEEI